MKKKFKAIEKHAKATPAGDIKDMKWEGEEVATDNLVMKDEGSGQPIVLRFFEFGVNFDAFKSRKPTAQELFNSHLNGIKSLLWRDGLEIYEAVEPRLMFSKDKRKYQFIIPCLPSQVLVDSPQTLTQLLTRK